MQLLIVCLFAAAVGLIITWLMERDRKEEERNERLKKDTQSMSRFFKIRKSINILCISHLPHLKPSQIALIDASRCKVCLDKRKA